VSDVINGCAGEVIDDIAASEGGSVGLFGKRIGDIKGLGVLAFVWYEGIDNIRIFETCCLS